MKAYSDLLSSNVQLDQIFFNILINGLMKQKQYQVALEVFQTMESRGYHYNEYTVSVIIQLFSYLGKQQEALDLYKLYNYDSIFVNSCLIKMYIHWRNYERVMLKAQITSLTQFIFTIKDHRGAQRHQEKGPSHLLPGHQSAPPE